MPRAHADERLDTELPGHGDDLAQFLQLLDDHDDLLPQLGAKESDTDKVGVLVTVANNEAAKLALQREAGEQFRFAAYLQAEVKDLARVQDLFHDLAELVHLDREHAAVSALVIELGDGVAEGHVDGLDAVAQDVLKANQDRELQSAHPGLFDHIGQIHSRAGVAQRFGHDAAGFIDVEVFGPPAMNVVQVAGVLDAPGLVGLARITHFDDLRSSALYDAASGIQ